MREILLGALYITIFMCLGFYLGKNAGYDRALEDMKAITPPPKTTDQQCVAWLFEANLKEVKRKICR